MQNSISLTEIALVVLGALAGGLFFARLRQPPVLGYILSGIILGPSGLALIQSREQVSLLAELGVLMLLFVIGMELSLRSFKKVWLVATLCTVLQIAISLVVTVALSSLFGWSSGLATLIGFVTALSSTAVVVKVLESIEELKTETGQLTIGVLIAQDLAIVPMILILRNFDKNWLEWTIIGKFILSIGLILALITYLSRRQRVKLPLTQIISGDKDLAPIASLTFCFAAAAASGLIGLSAAYGAFLAGLVLGNTHERLVMLESIKPIQGTLMMAFFLSIGLLLDVSFLWANIWTVLTLLAVITLGKTAINIGILHVLQLPWSQSFLIGVVLAQLGEFSFLLATVGYEAGMINSYGQTLIICITALSLMFSPFWLSTARRLRSFVDEKGVNLSTLLKVLYGNEFLQFKRISHYTVKWVQKRRNPPITLINYHPKIQEKDDTPSSKDDIS